MPLSNLFPPSSGGGSSTGPAPYLGHVATRCFQNNNYQLAATGRWQMSRTAHWARDAIVNPTVIYANYKVASTSEQAATGGTLKVTLEYPAGTFTLANECIAASNGPVSLTGGNNVFTFKVSVPNGKKFWMRTLMQNDSGVVYRQFQNNTHGAGPDPDDGWEIGTGTPSDKTASGTVSSNILAYFPAVIASQTTRPSFLIFGDSRQEGGWDQSNDLTYDVGEVPRAVGRTHGYSSQAVSATLLTNFLSGTNPNLRALATYFSHVVNAYGINDLNGGGRSVAQLTADRVSFAALFPNNSVIGCTLTPLTNSTDGWYTTANQSLSAAGLSVLAFNTAVRTGISGENAVWDLARGVDPYRTGLYPVSRNPSATTYGTTQTQFTGSISGSTLTVTAIAAGAFRPGDSIIGSLNGSTPTNPDPSTLILPFGTNGTTGTGGTGTYALSRPNQSVSSQTLYVGGLATADGLHGSVVTSEMIRDSGVVSMALAAR